MLVYANVEGTRFSRIEVRERNERRLNRCNFSLSIANTGRSVRILRREEHTWILNVMPKTVPFTKKRTLMKALRMKMGHQLPLGVIHVGGAKLMFCRRSLFQNLNQTNLVPTADMYVRT